TYPTTVMVPVGPEGHYKSFFASELVYARSDGKYTCLYFADGTQLPIRMLMRDFQIKLDPLQYIRIQRGYLVNREFIGDYVQGDRHWWVMLITVPEWKDNLDNGKLPVGGKYRYRVERALNIRK